MRSTKQKQLEYLKQIKFNGFTSTQSQGVSAKGGLIVGGDRAGSDQVRESDIVRDLLYVFQGIEGKLIHYSFAEDAFILQHSLMVTPSTRKIINELCELGWLFKRVNDWLKRNVETSASMDVN